MAYLTDVQREKARKLRKLDTAAEQRLWEHLRGRRLQGLKFVRQLPVGPYIADFACRERHLIVEVDGTTHSTEEELAYDTARTALLEKEGWRVVRVGNTDVFTRTGDVLEAILLATAAGA